MDLIHSGCEIIIKTVKDHPSKTVIYRIMDNKRMDHDTVLIDSFRQCTVNIDVEHVLCLQGAAEFSFGHKAEEDGKTDSDSSSTAKKEVAYLFCLPVFLCDPSGETVYWVSSASIYNSTWGRKDKFQRDFKNFRPPSN